MRIIVLNLCIILRQVVKNSRLSKFNSNNKSKIIAVFFRIINFFAYLCILNTKTLSIRMKILLRTYIFLLLASLLAGCRFGSGMDGLFGDDRLIIGGEELDSARICQTIDSIVDTSKDTLEADKVVGRIYKDLHELYWITSDGLSQEADSLLAYIAKADETGFHPSHFYHKELMADKERLDSLDFAEYDVYTVVARLDYMLTKAFVRYASWERYGTMNPFKVFNHLDHNKHDTLNILYNSLYDTPTELIGKKGYEHLVSLAGTDSVSELLRDAEPKTPLYRRLKQMLKDGSDDRQRILVNMERCRWRHGLEPEDCEKYVLVNIPSYELMGVDKDTIMEMRIVCGSRDTKTPLLNSAITRMDINPKWMMPFSVIKHEISHHAGDSGYFARHRYYITHHKTGERMNPARVTQEMLQSGAYRVTQEGGAGNALGRIIFRFDNKFSIYLHDTSSKGTFSRSDRRASHGCIRVERPYDLAAFLLDDKDETTLNNIRYSMSYVEGATPAEGEEEQKPGKLLHSLSVKPRVPIFIIYYTLFVMPDGTLRSYPDVYGYDAVVYSKIRKYSLSAK